MKKFVEILKKEAMLTIAVVAAFISLIITPPTWELLSEIDWHTLATLFMMLCVLEGFKKENIFDPVVRFAGKMTTMVSLSFFLIFGVFFTSMFVTNDVSLIIFVPLTILLFRAGGKEHYILPVISMENIAAIRGSLLTPFGSPQNLFLYGQSGVSAWDFMLHMSPLWISSIVLLSLFILFLYRKDKKEAIIVDEKTVTGAWKSERKIKRICYLLLFLLVITSIVTRTKFWPVITVVVAVIIFLNDNTILKRVDYVLLLTFFCFFVFSSSIAANASIAGFLKKVVDGNEYFSAILLSQVISNVPASIVLYPFSTNLAALLYGCDTAGLCSLIGSLASVINYRIYVREYPKNGGAFVKTFTFVSWCFFIIVVLPFYFLSCVWTF